MEEITYLDEEIDTGATDICQITAPAKEPDMSAPAVTSLDITCEIIFLAT